MIQAVMKLGIHLLNQSGINDTDNRNISRSLKAEASTMVANICHCRWDHCDAVDCIGRCPRIYEKEKEMNEWVVAAGAITVFVTVSGFIFGWGWKIIQDVKKSAHKRIDNVVEDMKDLENGCKSRLDTYVNKEDVNRIEKKVDEGFNALTGRIDSLLLAFSNGKSDRK